MLHRRLLFRKLKDENIGYDFEFIECYFWAR